MDYLFERKILTINIYISKKVLQLQLWGVAAQKFSTNIVALLSKGTSTKISLLHKNPHLKNLSASGKSAYDKLRFLALFKKVQVFRS